MLQAVYKRSTYLAHLRKWTRRLGAERERYAHVRRTALSACAAYRALNGAHSGTLYLAREDALADVVSARADLFWTRAQIRKVEALIAIARD